MCDYNLDRFHVVGRKARNHTIDSLIFWVHILKKKCFTKKLPVSHPFDLTLFSVTINSNKVPFNKQRAIRILINIHTHKWHS